MNRQSNGHVIEFYLRNRRRGGCVYVLQMFFCFFFVRHNDETTVLGNAWTDFRETFTKRQRGKWSVQRRTQMGARPQIIFGGLKTDIVRTGAAWRFFAGLKTDKSYLLVPPPGEWLRISLEPGYFYGGCVKKAWTSECI